MRCTLLPLLTSAAIVRAWLPDNPAPGASLSAFASSGTSKIRGVNAGSQYIIEPWMAADVWKNMLGCGNAKAERQCVETAYDGDMDAAGTAWKKHWDSWITQSDIQTMKSYGLNTIRIPVGFWMKEDLLNEYERFPRGGFNHLIKFCGWASDAGMYIIIDLHGMPGRQVANNAFTGDYESTTGFYQSDYESGRAYEFLSWIANQTHSNSAFRNVGALELVNEPKREDSGDTQWMVQHYYGSAIDAVREVEATLGVADAAKLHLAVMDDLWESGPLPSTALSASQLATLLYDDHNYQASPITSCGGALKCAISYTCSATVGQGNRVTSQTPKIVGEWALKLDQLGGQELANKDFFKNYAAAQMDMYEREGLKGWTYWSWKVQANENFTDSLQWSYKDAVTAGIIHEDLNAMVAGSPC